MRKGGGLEGRGRMRKGEAGGKGGSISLDIDEFMGWIDAHQVPAIK